MQDVLVLNLVVHIVTAKIYGCRIEGQEEQDRITKLSHTLNYSKSVILRFPTMQYGTNAGCSARLAALSQMTHNAQKRSIQLPSLLHSSRSTSSNLPAPCNIVSRPVNPPVGHLR
jgi:hypothetical protein